jgi:hypothetical protein
MSPIHFLKCFFGFNFVVLVVLGFELRASYLLVSALESCLQPFLWLFWRLGLTICLSWPQTEILQILASQVARITGMSHHCPASKYLNKFVFKSIQAGCVTPALGKLRQKDCEFKASLLYTGILFSFSFT